MNLFTCFLFFFCFFFPPSDYEIKTNLAIEIGYPQHFACWAVVGSLGTFDSKLVDSVIFCNCVALRLH